MLTYSCALSAQEFESVLDREVTHSFIGLTLGEVLKALESELDGLVFVYSPISFNMDRRVSARFHKEPLKLVLETVFGKGNIELKLKGDKIILKPKKHLSGGADLKVDENNQVRPSKQLERSQKLIVNNSVESDKSSVKSVKEQKLINLDSANIEKEVFLESNIDSLTIKQGSGSEIENQKSQITELVISRRISKIINEKPLPNKRLGALNATFYGGSRIKVDSTPFKTRVYQRALARYKRLKLRLNEDKKFRAYVSSYTGYTKIGDKDGIQMGGSLVWLKNKRWGFGLSGYAIQATEIEDQVLSGGYKVSGGYGGFLIEYTLKPSNRVHFSFPFEIGAGGIAYVQHPVSNGDRLIEDQKFIMAIKQGAAVEVNVIKYIRVGFEVNYRFTSNTSLNYQNTSGAILASKALTGLNFGIRVKFGLF